MSEELGWRQRAIALAVLGGAAMGRSAFAVRLERGPSPVRMQVLVSIAVYQYDDSGTSWSAEMAQALSLGQDTFWLVVRDLVSNDLVIYAAAPEYVEGAGTRDRDDEGDEDEETEPELRLTDAGWSMVISWLRGVEPMFHAWPPDRPDVDDAVD